jgi:hypothetical protein
MWIQPEKDATVTACNKQDIELKYCLKKKPALAPFQIFCEYCIPGYYEDVNGKCQPGSGDCNRTCRVCDTETTCKTISERATIENCNTMDVAAKMCIQCELGYILDVGSSRCHL